MVPWAKTCSDIVRNKFNYAQWNVSELTGILSCLTGKQKSYTEPWLKFEQWKQTLKCHWKMKNVTEVQRMKKWILNTTTECNNCKVAWSIWGRWNCHKYCLLNNTGGQHEHFVLWWRLLLLTLWCAATLTHRSEKLSQFSFLQKMDTMKRENWSIHPNFLT
jgi:hypothetical protein